MRKWVLSGILASEETYLSHLEALLLVSAGGRCHFKHWYLNFHCCFHPKFPRTSHTMGYKLLDAKGTCYSSSPVGKERLKERTGYGATRELLVCSIQETYLSVSCTSYKTHCCTVGQRLRKWSAKGF